MKFFIFWWIYHTFVINNFISCGITYYIVLKNQLNSTVLFTLTHKVYIFLRLWNCFYGHLAHGRIKKKRKFEPHSNKQREPLETIFACVFSEVRDITFIHLNALKAVAAIWATKFVDAPSSSSALQVDTNTLSKSHSNEELDALSAKLFSLMIHFHVYDAQLLGQELEFAKLTSKQLWRMCYRF